MRIQLCSSEISGFTQAARDTGGPYRLADLLEVLRIATLRYIFASSNWNGYKGLRPWMILIRITIIATTSNIWIKLPTIPSENPNSQRINRITTIVQNMSINLTSSHKHMYQVLLIFSLFS